MKLLRTRRQLLAAGALLCLRPAAAGEALHRHPVRLLLGYSPGGGGDMMGRAIAVRLGEQLGQPVIVVNLPGAGGAIAAGELMRAPADGSTLLLADSALLLTLGASARTARDPVPFTPVGLIGQLAFALVVHPDFPARNLREWLAEVRARPGRYAYASPGVGTIAHLGLERLCQAAGLELLHVPYKGGGQALTDLMAGQVEMALLSLPAALGASRAGRLRLLAISSAARSPQLPSVPTLAEVWPRLQVQTSVFLLAPPGLSPERAGQLNAALGKAMSSESIRAEFAAQGAVIRTGSPAELAAQLRQEAQALGALVESLGLALN